MRVTILGATGQVGQELIRLLMARGHEIVAVGRAAERLRRLPPGIVTRLVQFTDGDALARVLQDADYLVCCCHASELPRIVPAIPETVRRVVAMGSTRFFSEAPDETGDAVRAGIAALAACPIPSVMLLSTMIYGGEHARVVEGLARRLRQVPILPVPGGLVRVQPIHVADVAACLAAALTHDGAPGCLITIAGPRPITYCAMVEAIRDARVPGGRVLPVPVIFWRAAARVLSVLPGMGGVGRAIGRLCEDRVFDVQEMQVLLNIISREFQP